MAMRIKTIRFVSFVLVVCLSLAVADSISTENLRSAGFETEKEAQPNPAADSNSPDDDLSNLPEIPLEETDLDDREGDPAESNELEEEHEYFDHIDSNQGGSR